MASKGLLENYNEVLGGVVDIVFLPPIIPTNNLDKLRGGNKDTNIFFSGRMTKYRSLIIQEMTYCSEVTDIQSTLDMNIGKEESKNTMFVKKDKEGRNAKNSLTHELYIGQSSKWIYASPMRTYRSLRMGYIPVSDKKYIDELIDVSILPNTDNIETLLEKVNRYNTYADKEAKVSINKILH